MKTFLFYVLVFVLMCLGCSEAERREMEERRQQQSVDSTQAAFPSDAKLVEKLGKDWYVVEFKVQGVPTRYLYKWWSAGGHFHVTMIPVEKSSTQKKNSVVE
jgi:hypothetical protein